MTTIREALAGFYSDTNQRQRNIELGQYLSNLKHDPVMKPFIWILSKHLNLDGGVHPSTVDAICKYKLKCRTLEDIAVWRVWFASLHSDDLVEIVDPSLNIQTCGETNFDFIKSTLLASDLKFESHCKWYHADDAYQKIGKAALDEILCQCPIKRLRYKQESRDCDDFAKMFLGWLAYKGFGNLTIGRADVNVYDGASKISAHAVNIFVADGETGFVEPQTGKIVSGVNWRIRDVRF